MPASVRFEFTHYFQFRLKKKKKKKKKEEEEKKTFPEIY